MSTAPDIGKKKLNCFKKKKSHDSTVIVSTYGAVAIKQMPYFTTIMACIFFRLKIDINGNIASSIDANFHFKKSHLTQKRLRAVFLFFFNTLIYLNVFSTFVPCI